MRRKGPIPASQFLRRLREPAGLVLSGTARNRYNKNRGGLLKQVVACQLPRSLVR